MKIFGAVLLTLFWGVFSFAKISGRIHSDKNGMPRCIEGDPAILIFWDGLSKAVPKIIYAITLEKYAQENHHFLKSCVQWPYAKAWPEGLVPLSETRFDLPEAILPALQQIAQGARLYHSEKTASDFYKKHPDYFKLGKAEPFTELQKNYGRDFANQLLQEWVTDLVKKKKMDLRQCSALIGTCEYYLCQEANNKCGVSSYLVGFGYKYCSLSLDGLYQKMESKLGKSWTLQTASCLQRKVEEDLVKSMNPAFRCEQIAQDAYASHPICYVQNGFCEMSMKDKIHIFDTVKSQIFKAPSLAQMFQTLSKCGVRNESIDQ